MCHGDLTLCENWVEEHPSRHCTGRAVHFYTWTSACIPLFSIPCSEDGCTGAVTNDSSARLASKRPSCFLAEHRELQVYSISPSQTSSHKWPLPFLLSFPRQETYYARPFSILIWYQEVILVLWLQRCLCSGLNLIK